MIPFLKALQAFEAVGTRGSVTAAAHALGVSPGAISQQVHKLEAHLGITLLERGAGKMELTTWGRIYHAEIKKGFDHLANAQHVLSRARNESGITLSSLTSVVNKWIGREIFDWQALYPNAMIHLVGTEREPTMGQDDVDFRIYYGQNSHHQYFVELFTDWVVPACAPRLIETNPPQAITDILSFPLLHIVWDAAFSPAPSWSDWARSIGCPRPPADKGLSYTLSSSAIDAAVAGRGFVLAQLAMIADELKSGRLAIPFDHRLKLSDPYLLAWNRASLQKPFGPEFRRWIISTGKRQAAISAPST
ncbi:LysR family transcriptional regulator [Rhizobium tubonense]|uniref:LysR family transcriptional regulator n=1 Tax=Rhizobium tubonense TaxID=484088 RepID=A0A2W4CDE2_9HYPH|nr:LysR family transcriptional regulator [Rhizobium tubonense]PZM08825.1 LysR family transcriptional regulator [Rhizobium tubonense]